MKGRSPSLLQRASERTEGEAEEAAISVFALGSELQVSAEVRKRSKVL